MGRFPRVIGVGLDVGFSIPKGGHSLVPKRSIVSLGCQRDQAWSRRLMLRSCGVRWRSGSD